MKIAYILNPDIVISGPSNGIKSQAITWKSGLEQRGHIVDEINTWNNYKWHEYDVIHIFGPGLWLPVFVKDLVKKNPNIVFSPIIDSLQRPYMYNLASFWGYSKLRLWSPTYALKKSLPYLKGVFVRSDYESRFFNESIGLVPKKIFKVPLAYNASLSINTFPKEDFCLHISSIYQERKNVRRLIQAAKKYNFPLILAGSTGSEKDFLPIKNEIGNASNIKVMGFVSHEKMVDLYTKAKVFALPSISEGVGIVALDAAVYGCEIVITKLGGPSEYFNGMAGIVNPYDVDEIGKAITQLMNDKSYQPALKTYISENYSNETVSKMLEKAYFEIMQNPSLENY